MCEFILNTHSQWSISACATPFLLGNFPNGDGEMGVHLAGYKKFCPPKRSTTRKLLQLFFFLRTTSRFSPHGIQKSVLMAASY